MGEQVILQAADYWAMEQFAGVFRQQDRDDLIACLLETTANSGNE